MLSVQRTEVPQQLVSTQGKLQCSRKGMLDSMQIYVLSVQLTTHVEVREQLV